MFEVQIFDKVGDELLEIGTQDYAMIPHMGDVLEIDSDDDRVLVTVLSVTESPKSGSDYAIVILYI
jgi:hypothetical protein